MLRAIYSDLRTTYEALKEGFDNVTWTEGCDYVGDGKNDFDGAMSAAKDADVVIMALGGRNGWGLHCNSGEGADTTDIGLPGCQEELLRHVYSVNQNMVLVHTDCRPIVSEWIYEHVPAVLEAWLPCTYGGIAIAETIIGENNPGGRLQVDVPRTSAHGPLGHYLNRGSDHESFAKGAINKQGYLEVDMRPRFPFGHGLSYTTFCYDGFKVQMDSQGQVTAEVRVTNTGNRKGDEVVQLYGIDPIASIIRPAEELVGFKRITLEPGESKTVRFTFNLDIMAFYDNPGHWIVEAGEFEFYVGRSSKERIESGKVRMDKTREIDHARRCLVAEAVCA